MSPEQALTVMSICAIVGTGLNVWLTLRIGNSVIGLKLWTRENFVAKEDVTRYFGPFRQTVQRHQSEERQEMRG